MQKLNPIITIFTGVIVTFAGVYTGFLIMNIPESGIIGGLLLPISIIIGGFIATYFTKERKIRYGIYDGLIISLLFSIYTLIQMLNDTGIDYVGYAVLIGGFTILITLGACLGGISGSKKNLIIPILPF